MNAPDPAGAPAATPPLASIVVTPRERWSLAKRSLEDIIANTTAPHELIYVDGGMPAKVRDEIKALCDAHGHAFVSPGGFLSPNQARNIGVTHARGKYVVFIDNDVFVAPNWLEALVGEAEASGADVVGPMTCQGEPLHKTIHHAGGTFAADPDAFFATPHGNRRISDEMFLQTTAVDDPAAPREAFDTQVCEFHCVLVRRDVFSRFGPLDEGMMATKEQLDLCMTIIKGGGRVRIAPASIATYVFPTRNSPLLPTDRAYFILRWSPQWQKASMDRMREKWGLGEDPYYQERLAKLQWRHQEGVVKPLLQRVPFIARNPKLHHHASRVLRGLCRVAAAVMAARHRAQSASASRDVATGPVPVERPRELSPGHG
jgi:cellulose synthase/poly-beta-1,6-N-acetylglucosamine synthase-like glycosyltransferase